MKLPVAFIAILGLLLLLVASRKSHEGGVQARVNANFFVVYALVAFGVDAVLAAGWWLSYLIAGA